MGFPKGKKRTPEAKANMSAAAKARVPLKEMKQEIDSFRKQLAEVTKARVSKQTIDDLVAGFEQELASYEAKLEELREETESGYASVKSVRDDLLLLIDQIGKLEERIAQVEAADDARIEEKIRRMPQADLRRFQEKIFRPTVHREHTTVEEKRFEDETPQERGKRLTKFWREDLKPIGGDLR